MTPQAESLQGAAAPRRCPFLIGGKWVEAESGRSFATRNPATGELLAEVAEADHADVAKAVAAARKAFEGRWSKLSARERGQLLFRLAQLIDSRVDELALLETTNSGKPIKESLLIDLPQVVENFEYFAGWATKIEGETIPVPGQMLNYSVREPVGVCAQIIPWNFPLMIAAWKLAPALAAGNTVVLKPAEQTPLSALELGKLIQEAGFPPGVVNIVPGFGETAGAALAAQPGVDAIAFTGSTEVGKRIAKAAAANVTRVSLELGGKSPNIVFADADLEAAVQGAMAGIFLNQGQVCCAGSRVFVEESVQEEFLMRLKDQTERLVIGDPRSRSTQLGPQVSREQLERVKTYVEQALAEGANVLSGGVSPVMEGALRNGHFFPPTILTRVQNRMRVAQEEIFGPVAAVIPFRDEVDVIAQANDTVHGLSAGIWTRDLARAHRCAKAIRAGVVWINTFNQFNAASPFGGCKQSGYGRDLSRHALEHYTNVKSVWVDFSGRPMRWFGGASGPG